MSQIQRSYVQDEWSRIFCATKSKLSSQAPWPTANIGMSRTLFTEELTPQINAVTGAITTITHQSFCYKYLIQPEIHQIFENEYIYRFKDQNGRTIPMRPPFKQLVNSIGASDFYQLFWEIRTIIQQENQNKLMEHQKEYLKQLLREPENDMEEMKEPQLMSVPCVVEYVHEMAIGIHNKNKLRIILNTQQYDQSTHPNYPNTQ
eukprot:1129843_1